MHEGPAALVTARRTPRLQAGQPPPPPDRLDHPITDVSWFDALAYCAWLRQQCKPRVYALPSEAEWEKAAALSHTPGPSGGGAGGGGRRRTASKSVGRRAGVGTRSLWGSRPRTQPGFGYPYDSGDDREITDWQHLPAQAWLVHRGGSFKSRPEDLRATARGNALPDKARRSPSHGFRVVMQIP